MTDVRAGILGRVGFGLACVGLVATILAYLGNGGGFEGDALGSIDFNSILLQTMITTAACALLVGAIAGALFARSVRTRFARVVIVMLTIGSSAILCVQIAGGFITQNISNLMLYMTCDEDGVCTPAGPDLSWIWWYVLAGLLIAVSAAIRVLSDQDSRPIARALPSLGLLVLSAVPFVSVAGLAGFVVATAVSHPAQGVADGDMLSRTE